MAHVPGGGGGARIAAPVRILLVDPPLHRAYMPSLAIEQLAEIGRNAGFTCETFYAMLRMPPRFPGDFVEALGGPAAFAASYYGVDRDQLAHELATARLRGGVGPDVLAERFEDTVTGMLVAIDAAEECVKRVVADIPIGAFDMVGFSVSFDAQKLPAACLARSLKQREPHLRVIFGGTGCDGAMGPALLELFPEIDVVAAGEAESSFVRVVRRLIAEDADDSTIPDTHFRDCPRVSRVDKPLRTAELDPIPTPDYHSFFRQLDESEYAGSPRFTLFETSRGCWWGAKHHCRFCGILAVAGKYRSKLPANVLSQITALAEKWKPDVLYSTDAILDMAYFADLLPELARRRQEEGWTFECFFEVKSNLKRHQLAALAAAGITWLQPGIESFSTNILKLVGKGATCLQQVELLKWARAYCIRLSYGLLVGVPGESLADYAWLIEVSKRLHHLPPPVSVNGLGLHRFSPYFDQAEQYGIYDIRPFAVQRLTYRDATDELLSRACYGLDYSCRDRDINAMEAARLQLEAAVAEWRNVYFAGARLVVAVTSDGVVVTRRLWNGELEVSRLRGVAGAVYRALTAPKSLDRLASELSFAPADVSAVLADFTENGWVLCADGRFLALAVPVEAEARTDASLERLLQQPLNSTRARQMQVMEA